MTSAWRRPAERPWVLGHRGARHAAPENTLAAFELALEEGADGVELDVRLAAGEVIVFHDRSLQRMTERRDLRNVEALSRHELLTLRVGNEPVPTLAAVLAWAKQRDTRVNVEIKHDTSHPLKLVRRVIELVRRHPRAPERIIVSCFHPLLAAVLPRWLDPVPAAWLVHDRQRWLKEAPGIRFMGSQAVHPQHTLITRSRIERWRRAGLAINTWTVNDPERGRALAELGVDGLISDNPARLLARLG